MKLIKISAKYTEAEILKIIADSNTVSIETINQLYDTFSKVEYIDKYGFVAMFCIVDVYTLSMLLDKYKQFGIKVSVEDLTNKVLMGNKIIADTNDDTKNLDKLVNSFIKTNLTIDYVLDKINEHSISSLNIVDRKVLNKI